MLTYEELQGRLFQAENRVSELERQLAEEKLRAARLNDISRENFDKLQQWQTACLTAEKQRDAFHARLSVACEVSLISSTYDRVRSEQVFAIDDTEYDLFAAGWKAAIASVKGGAA